MPSRLRALKNEVGESTTKEALNVAIDFTVKNYRKVMEKVAKEEIKEMKEDVQCQGTME